MKALIQRVRSASVTVDGVVVGEIGQGLLVLLGVEKKDDASSVEKIAHKLLHYRVFADEQGKMNQSVADVDGALLVVSQFTLAASTQKGMRPSFSSAAEPALAEQLYKNCVAKLKKSIKKVETGVFAADMQVSLINDGPVTFLLES